MLVRSEISTGLSNHMGNYEKMYAYFKGIDVCMLAVHRSKKTHLAMLSFAYVLCYLAMLCFAVICDGYYFAPLMIYDIQY